MPALFVNHYLDKPKSTSETYILHFIRHGTKRMKISSGFRVKPSDWNTKKQSFRASVQGYEIKNEILRKHKWQIEEVYEKAILKGISVNKKYFETTLSFSSKFEKEKGVIEYFDDYIAFSETARAKATVSVLRTTKKHLIDFSAKYSFELSFAAFNAEFYEMFMIYILDNLDLYNNALGKYIKTIKSFLNWSLDKGVHSNTDFKKFKVYNEANEPLPLSMEELEKIESLDLNESLSNVRDLFLLECYTGLRFSDLIELRKEHIQGDFIHKIARKTKRPVKVPMTMKARTIVQKYLKIVNGHDFNLLPDISNQKMNSYLKDLCELAEMDDEVILSKFKGAKRVDRVVKKFDAITTHCGRDTFITNSLMMGIPESTIMTIVGHVKYEAFKKYVKLKDQYLVDAVKVWD